VKKPLLLFGLFLNYTLFVTVALK